MRQIAGGDGRNFSNFEEGRSCDTATHSFFSKRPAEKGPRVDLKILFLLRLHNRNFTWLRNLMLVLHWHVVFITNRSPVVKEVLR